MDRFIAERALVLRPESMTSLRGGMRRFGLWLDTERPHIESLAELTGADLVAFMQAVHQLRKIKHPDQPISPAYRDAEKRGWEREVDRHQRIADRIRSLLGELGEPSGPAAGLALIWPGKIRIWRRRAPLGPRAGQSPPPSSTSRPQ